MDRVRFGRALGFGARQAVKTLVTAVDAATAENPSRKGASRGADSARNPQPANASAPAPGGAVSPAQQAAGAPPQTLPAKAAHRAAQTVIQTREVRQGLKRGRKRFGQAAWEPFVRLSGVLWLEFAGVFFGLFALFAAGGVWKLRGQWRSATATADGHRQLLGALAMMVLFSYFCVSSFVRARRREGRK
jgi:hypothetical protein